MSRRRAPEYDYICRRCGCAAEGDGSRHLGGGPGMKACRRKPGERLPVILRSEHEKEVADIVAMVKSNNRL